MGSGCGIDASAISRENWRGNKIREKDRNGEGKESGMGRERRIGRGGEREGRERKKEREEMPERRGEGRPK